MSVEVAAEAARDAAKRLANAVESSDSAAVLLRRVADNTPEITVADAAADRLNEIAARARLVAKLLQTKAVEIELADRSFALHGEHDAIYVDLQGLLTKLEQLQHTDSIDPTELRKQLAGFRSALEEQFGATDPATLSTLAQDRPELVRKCGLHYLPLSDETSSRPARTSPTTTSLFLTDYSTDSNSSG